MKNSKNVLFVVLATMGLAACGGGSDPVPVPVVPAAVTPVTVPQPTYSQFGNGSDYVGQYIVPQLQAQYGDIQIIGNVYIVTAAGGAPQNLSGQTISWATLYTQYIQGLAVACGSNCQINNIPGMYGQQGYGQPQGAGGGFSGWASMNYNNFDSYISGGFGTGDQSYYSDWFDGGLVRMSATGMTTSFISVINILVYSNYNVYSNYYQNYYRSSYPSYQWPCSHYSGYIGGNVYASQYGYRPYNQVNGGFNYSSGNGSGSNWSLNLGGFFNF